MNQKPHKGFAFAVIHKLLTRVCELKNESAGRTGHMLVFAKSHWIRVKTFEAYGRVFKDEPPATITEFGSDRVAMALPPQALWPDLPPARAVIAEPEFENFRPCAQEPYRVHLFFGALETVEALAEIAAELVNLEPELGAEIFGNPRACGALASISDRIHGETETAIDTWMCTVHWWSWFADEMSGLAKTYVVHRDAAIEVGHLDQSFRDRLSYSQLNVDVFAATEATLRLLLKFFEKPPVIRRWVRYPPPVDEPCTDNEDRVDDSSWQAEAENEGEPNVGGESQQKFEDLSEAVRLAWTSYELAESVLIKLGAAKVTDDAAYAWVKESIPDGYTPPKREAWKRHVREARRVLERNKNRPRAGRTGGSIQKADEL